MAPARIATRLTCFAIISAVESDLRTLVRLIAARSGRNDLFPDDVKVQARKRWEEDRTENEEERDDADAAFLEYIDFADISKILYRISEDFELSERPPIHKLAERLVSLSPIRNRVCHSRPLEPDDFAALYDAARDLRHQYKTIEWRELVSTMQKLEKDPSFVLHLTVPSFWSLDEPHIPNNLPLPEFDDTGFLGRISDRREVHRLLVSPHPVISIVGEGGVGKTALAIRCLNDLLEDSNRPLFDAIVWVSLKTRQLTPGGVQEIEQNIASTLGLVRAVGAQLGVPAANAAEMEALLGEIREYLTAFRVLLALDNFETIQGEIPRLLLSTIPTGSKVLITSRIGLGEIELRYPLNPLDVSTAVSLARRYSKALNAELTAQAPESVLARYCGLLYYNPLLIKWFVFGVANGNDPSKLLRHEGQPFKDALKFCFESVFEHLTEQEKELIHILASARRPLSQAELYYLTEKRDRDEIDWALNTLQYSSMLRRLVDRATKGGDSPTLYTLTELSVEYVARWAPPTSATYAQVQHSLKKLRELADAEINLRAVYAYDISAVHTANRDERICASYLRQAAALAFKSDIEGARKSVEQAKALLPTYSEAYRVSAFVESRAGDWFKATEEYETALEYNPRSTITLYAYALFLLRFLDDIEGALEQINAALVLDPKAETLLGTKALLLTRLARHEEAAHLYEDLLRGLGVRPKKWRITTRDQAAECYRRWAEQDMRMRDDKAFRTHLGRSIEIIEEAFVVDDYDRATLLRFAKAVDEALDFATSPPSIDYALQILHVLERNKPYFELLPLELVKLARFLDTFKDNEHIHNVLVHLPIREAIRDLHRQESEKPRIHGRVSRVRAEKKFGFIVDDQGHDWFFHRNALRNRREWEQISDGVEVSFITGRNEQGPCAVDVYLTAYPRTGSPESIR